MNKLGSETRFGYLWINLRAECKSAIWNYYSRKNCAIYV